MALDTATAKADPPLPPGEVAPSVADVPAQSPSSGAAGVSVKGQNPNEVVGDQKSFGSDKSRADIRAFATLHALGLLLPQSLLLFRRHCPSLPLQRQGVGLLEILETGELMLS